MKIYQHYAPTTLCIEGGLPEQWTSETISRLCDEEMGAPVAAVSILLHPVWHVRQAFIRFESPAAATKAYSYFDQLILPQENGSLQVEFDPDETQLFVQWDWEEVQSGESTAVVTEATLAAMFDEFEKMKSSSSIVLEEKGRNCALVTFASPGVAAHAMRTLKHRNLDNNTLLISLTSRGTPPLQVSSNTMEDQVEEDDEENQVHVFSDVASSEDSVEYDRNSNSSSSNNDPHSNLSGDGLGPQVNTAVVPSPPSCAEPPGRTSGAVSAAINHDPTLLAARLDVLAAALSAHAGPTITKTGIGNLLSSIFRQLNIAERRALMEVATKTPTLLRKVDTAAHLRGDDTLYRIQQVGEIINGSSSSTTVRGGTTMSTTSAATLEIAPPSSSTMGLSALRTILEDHCRQTNTANVVKSIITSSLKEKFPRSTREERIELMAAAVSWGWLKVEKSYPAVSQQHYSIQLKSISTSAPGMTPLMDIGALLNILQSYCQRTNTTKAEKKFITSEMKQKFPRSTREERVELLAEAALKGWLRTEKSKPDEIQRYLIRVPTAIATTSPPPPPSPGIPPSNPGVLGLELVRSHVGTIAQVLRENLTNGRIPRCEVGGALAKSLLRSTVTRAQRRAMLEALVACGALEFSENDPNRDPIYRVFFEKLPTTQPTRQQQQSPALAAEPDSTSPPLPKPTSQFSPAGTTLASSPASSPASCGQALLKFHLSIVIQIMEEKAAHHDCLVNRSAFSDDLVKLLPKTVSKPERKEIFEALVGCGSLVLIGSGARQSVGEQPIYRVVLEKLPRRKAAPPSAAGPSPPGSWKAVVTGNKV